MNENQSILAYFKHNYREQNTEETSHNFSDSPSPSYCTLTVEALRNPLFADSQPSVKIYQCFSTTEPSYAEAYCNVIDCPASFNLAVLLWGVCGAGVFCTGQARGL